jgi:hypothetical protein
LGKARFGFSFSGKSSVTILIKKLFVLLHDIFASDETQFHIKLGKLWLTITSRIFIAHAFCKLEILFHARLTSKAACTAAEIAEAHRMFPARSRRNDIASRTFRSWIGKKRRFDFKKVL